MSSDPKAEKAPAVLLNKHAAAAVFSAAAAAAAPHQEHVLEKLQRVVVIPGSQFSLQGAQTPHEKSPCSARLCLSNDSVLGCCCSCLSGTPLVCALLLRRLLLQRLLLLLQRLLLLLQRLLLLLL